MNQEIKLLPCPWCGSDEWELIDDEKGMGDHVEPVFYIFCRGCGAGGPSGDTELEAVERWQKRRET